MVFWRISRHQDLRGIGGLRASARWHYAGQPVVHLAENPASALLEVCVYTAANDVPPAFTLLLIESPELSFTSISEDDLPQNWQTRLDLTRDLGTEWLRSNAGCLLRIPSAVVPHTSNFLLNPVHPDARLFRIAETLSYPFDGRLKR